MGTAGCSSSQQLTSNSLGPNEQIINLASRVQLLIGGRNGNYQGLGVAVVVYHLRHGLGDSRCGFWTLGPNRFTSLGLSLAAHGVGVIKLY